MESQVHTLMPPLTIVALKMWAYSPKITKNLKATYRHVQTLRISEKLCKRVASEGQIYGQNSKY